MKTKHTPDTWEIHSDCRLPDGTEVESITEGKILPSFIAHCEGPNRKANAQFIVQAVNHHEELVAALEEVRVFARLSCPQGVDRDLWQSTFNRVESILTKLKG